MPSDFIDAIEAQLNTKAPAEGRSAAEKLVRDVFNANASLSPDRFSELSASVARKLNDKGYLTELAVDFAMKNGSKYDTNKDGTLDRNEIETALLKEQLNRATCQLDTSKENPNCKNNEYEKLMLQQLSRKYDDLKKEVLDYNKGGQEGRDAITYYDSKSYLDRTDKSRQEFRANMETLQFAKPLLNASLFRTLDDAENNKNQYDGRIDKDDLKAFIHKYDGLIASGAKEGELGVYNRQNREFVQKLMDTWDKGEGKNLRGDDNAITLESFKRVSGVKDATNLNDIAVKLEMTELAQKMKEADSKPNPNGGEKKVDDKEKEKAEKEKAEKEKADKDKADKEKGEKEKAEKEKGDKTVVAAAADPAAAAKAKSDLINLSTVKAGQGPYQVAESLLGPGAKVEEILNLTKILKADYIKSHGGNADSLRSLKVGYHWLTEENFDAIMKQVPALQNRLSATAAPKK